MSRQFDEHMANRFELFGEMYEMVEPTDFEELLEALRIRDLLQQGADSYDTDSENYWENLVLQQEEWIDEYITNLGELDYSLISRNIAYLTKKSGMGIGDLERLIGISAGYISRTTKGNSNKKMSVDNIWRIARLFEVDMRALIETDLQQCTQNTALASQFIRKLLVQTEQYQIEWQAWGGSMYHLDARLQRTGLFEDCEVGTRYRPQHLNPEMQFILADDVYVCSGIAPGKLLTLIAYHPFDKLDSYNVDFWFISDNNSEPKCDKLFFTGDDISGILPSLAKELVAKVVSQELDTKITPEMRSFITDYLK